MPPTANTPPNAPRSASRRCVDWNMPEMNGIEFVRAVREDPRYVDVTLMMVTTEVDVHNVVRALAAGANEYVMKPFTADTIIGKLEILGLVG